MRATLFALNLTFLLAAGLDAQQTGRTEPVQAIRDNGTGYHALVGARVVTAPGQVIENATIVIRDGLIRSVGRNQNPPAGARVWDLTGLTVYPGFIDAHADLGMNDVPEGGDVGPTHWNPQVRAWFSTTANLKDDADRRKAVRSQGFGAALVVPKLGIFRGTASVVNLGDAGVRDRVLRADVAQSVGFERSGELGSERYPNSAMGVIALMKQTLMDADWYERAWAAYEESGRAFLPPETSAALDALHDVIHGRQPVLFETGSEEDYLRGRKLAADFHLVPWFRGSGEEYRIVDVLRGRTDPLILPLNFPDAPDVDDPEAALNTSLADLRHWYQAPASPATLAGAGIQFALTTDGLSDVDDFLPNLRTAVARGLSPEVALAALTTTPARWLGIERTHGTIERGKVANLVVSKGDLFTEEATVRDVWVHGVVYGVTRAPQIDPRGTWMISSTDPGGFEAQLRLEGTLNRLRGYIDVAPGGQVEEGQRIEIKSASVVTETGRVEIRFDGEFLGFRGTALLAGAVSGDTFYGWSSLPNGASPSFRGTRTEPFTGPAAGTVASKVPPIDLPFIRPNMEYGVPSLPERPGAVVVRDATIWTMGPQGRLEQADLLIRNGRIVEVGTDLTAPRGAVVIDGTGKHVTPGLIDPHIHSGVSDVNETGATIVPEVQMGDVITHNNIWMYRQLAGGLTTAMIKHGSANPIGGENVIVKMRWGGLPDQLKLDSAPRLVKFALGENPKRCCFEGRYPDTRMGTQAIIRDHFMAARDYEREWQRWEQTHEGLPPRRDLRMEAILDILHQELLISSHGYRADGYLALIRLAEEFGFRVQVLQHAVEAYKIAPELAQAGVAAAVWSDWGAFKIEAYDATKYNARILMEAGVTVSLHSDNSQVSSRMNWEAGKLLRTGLTEEQALSTVTINAAKVLAIANRVGSLEPGKDADFVIWNGDPLSQFTRAEQTWIDGRRYFSLEEDKARREQVQTERQQLIQAVLAASEDEGAGRQRAARAGR